MTTHALPLRAAARERVLVQPVLDGLFLATVLTVTFHKLQWELAGSLTLSDVLTSVFLVLFVWDRLERADARLTRTAIVAFAFMLAFALVYLAGFYNLDTGQALAQWSKGMVKYVLHFGFLVTGVALLARRSLAFYWLALAAFCGGIAVNALYGVVQLALAEVTGTNLDSLLIEPITSRQTGINVFGAVGGVQEVFRPNALTGDPNHLGIELVIPLLVLTPLYLRLEAGIACERRLRRSSSSCSSSSSRRSRGAACSGSRVARSCSRSRTGATSIDQRSSCRSAPSSCSSARSSSLGSTSS